MADLDEKETMDAIRAWWAENGNYVMGGVGLGLVLIIGWNWWQGSTAAREAEASVMFEDVMETAARGNLDNTVAATEALLAAHDGTSYASLGRLAVARLFMDSGRDQDAADALQDVLDHEGDSGIGLTARLRLGKVLMFQDRAEEVVELLADRPESAYTARFSEVLGDAYQALGDFEKAEAAYIAALNDNPRAPTVNTNIVQLKINDLPASGESLAEDTAPTEGANELIEEVAEELGDEAEAAVEEVEPAADEVTGDVPESE